MRYEIIFTEPFKRKLKKLKKKYPHIKNDLSRVLSDMENGESLGYPIPELFNRVYKVRVGSSDMKRGKRGSYRIIHYLEDRNSMIYLLTIYGKPKRENIPVKSIIAILKELDLKFK